MVIVNTNISNRLKEQVDSLIKKGNKNLLKMDSEATKLTADELMEIACNYNYNRARAYGFLFQGVTESIANHFLDALDYFFESIKIVESLQNKILLSRIYTNIGRAYGGLDEHKKSLKYSLKAVEQHPRNTSALINTAIASSKTGDDISALQYFEKCLELCRETGEENNLPIALLGVGIIQQRNNDLESSLENLKQAVIYAQKHNMKHVNERILYNIGIVYNKMNLPEKAEKYLIESLEKSEKLNDKENISFCCDSLAAINGTKKEYQKVIEYQNRYIKVKDELFSDTMHRKVNILQDIYDYEKKKRDKKEKILKKTNQAIQEKLTKLSHAYAEVSGIGRVGIFSSKMNSIMKMADFFHSDRNVPVLIEGETGTGKEIIARIVHFGDKGTTSPFVILNCSAISSSLFESELFGYEEGAFTGAKKDGMMGKLELAQGGTLFLDEIGELPLELQPKLLRVLQQKEFYRIGGKKPIKLDVRIICATNRDLKTEMDSNRFRSDLYYRLNTGKLFIPPLRERQEEIVPLAEMFLLKYSEEKKRDFRYINEKAATLLSEYSWPGNVRELENAIERVVLIYNEPEAQPWHFNFITDLEQDNKTSQKQGYLVVDLPEEGKSLESIEEDIIRKVLAKFEGNQVKAAEYLDVSRHTIYRKKKKHRI